MTQRLTSRRIAVRLIILVVVFKLFLIAYDWLTEPGAHINSSSFLLGRVALVAQRPIVINVDDLSACASVRLSVQCIVEKRRKGSGCRLAS